MQAQLYFMKCCFVTIYKVQLCLKMYHSKVLVPICSPAIATEQNMIVHVAIHSHSSTHRLEIDKCMIMFVLIAYYT